MFYNLAKLTLITLVSNYIDAYEFKIDLPDSAKSEIETCIQRSRMSPAIDRQAEMACGHEYFEKLGPNNLTDDDWAIFEEVKDDSFGHTPPSFGISIRREVRTLSEVEWQNVVDVFRELYDTGVLQSFGRLHGKVKLRAHKGGAFLPWHRVFLAHFEQEMKKINPSVSLPYWDYTIDTEIVQPFEAVLWTPCFFGEKTGTVRSGSFKLMYGAHGSVLSRKLADKAYSTRLINKRDIQNLKGFCSFKDITTGILEDKNERNLETLHDSVHDYIGGDMGVVENSAYDPIFWFHHAFIDYIWESFREHQTENCGHIDIETDYRPKDDIGWKNIIGQGHEDALFGYSHLKTVDGLWRNWTQMFYKYEPQPACDSTCSGEYLYCDDQKRCLSRTVEACKKEFSTRNKREVNVTDQLVPQIPCESGTKIVGLKGDGRTIKTSKEECEKILQSKEQIAEEPRQEESKNTSAKNFGFVTLGAVASIGFVVIVRQIRKRRS
ncbi:putative tyrosinase-like protein tyr-3 [Ruditapes philippinarum]|uniref:putative tyrosinase-like protein tyr-3 n=1 Tax=Ruditapes philippinarum TaxID=129788 RepID=UPI00295AC1CA|nr:putative tyrosinase-like protein tyr-3 [Ruditapes philippinarum]